MESITNFSLLTLGALVAILNPVGILPNYIAFTSELNHQEKKLATKRAIIIATTLLVLISFFGSSVFTVFGITTLAFKIAGGIILFTIALNMLNVRPQRFKSTPEELSEGVEKEDISAFPLAIPLLAGPGSITTVLMLGEKASNVYEHLVLAFVLVLCLFLLYFLLRQAIYVTDRLGKIGMNVLTRLMGLILAAIAVQFVLEGLNQFQNQSVF